MGNYCEQLVHSRYLQLGLHSPAHGRSSVAGPGAESGRSPAVGIYEGWVTSYGVCGHLLDSLSAWDHSVTLLKPEQARFGRFYGIMFFRKASPQTEGRRHADPGIKLPPDHSAQITRFTPPPRPHNRLTFNIHAHAHATASKPVRRRPLHRAGHPIGIAASC